MNVSEWDRSAPWRQGSIVRPEQTQELDPAAVTVVISHDCDCVNDMVTEPDLEVIPARIVDRIDGNYTYGKNVRVLHLPVFEDGRERVIELRISDRRRISKQHLAGLLPDPCRTIRADARQTLSRWLAARYLRAALPESLARRLKPMDRIFKKVAESGARELLGIYIDFDPKEETADDGIPYDVQVIVVFDSAILTAKETAIKAVGMLNTAFANEYRELDSPTGPQWGLVQLQFCEAASDIEFTLRDLRTYSLYRLEHISLKQDMPESIAPI